MGDPCIHPNGYGTPCPDPQPDWEALVREYLPEVPEDERAQMVATLAQGAPRVAAVTHDTLHDIEATVRRELARPTVSRDTCPTCHERGFTQCHCEAAQDRGES